MRSGSALLEGAAVPKIKEEITPSHLRCSYGGCPGVFKLSDGDLLIIGKAIPAELLKQIEGRIAGDEIAVKLSPEFFKALAE